MDRKNHPANGDVRNQPYFFTLHNGSGNQNPRSRWVILTLKEMGHHAYVWKSQEEIELAEPVAGMVALFDTDCVSAPSFIEIKQKDDRTPKWARMLATASCAGICREAVCTQKNINEVARNLIKHFAPYFGSEPGDRRDRKEPYRRPVPVLGRDRSRDHGRSQAERDPCRKIIGLP